MPASLARRFLRILVACILSLSASAYAGTFKNPELIATSYDPIAVATADLNHDGNPDIVYVDGMGDHTLHVLLGNGDGTFAHGQDVILPEGICGFLSCVINLADVTHDGNTDIIVGGAGTSTAQLAALLGNGDGTFQQPIVSKLVDTGGNYPALNTQMGIGDINGDGAVDLVVPDPMGAQLYVLLGNNTGKFSIGTAMTFYFTGQTVAYLVDLNGDGHLDIVVNDRVGATTTVLLGNGDGTFQAPVRYVSFAMLMADMDGDGRPDLVANVYPGQIEVLRGNPDGTFGSASVVATVPTFAFLVATGDFNGDGIADLVFLTPAGIGILLGKGNLTYGSMISSVSGSLGAVFLQTGDIAQADFNRDGHNDIAMGVEGGVLILQGNGDGSFVSADSYDIGHTVGTVGVADFNGDKFPDIAVTVPATFPRLLLGNGNGTFKLAPDQNHSYGSQTPSASLTLGDFNGDKKEDLALVEVTNDYPYGQLFALFGQGNGTFATPVAIPTGPALVGDLNNDGRSDMISLGNGSIVAMLGQSDGGFRQVSTALSNPTFDLGALGDVNRDGKPDLLVFEYPLLRLWLGNGDGTFTKSILLGDPQNGFFGGQPISIADLDGDGNADVVILPNPNPAALAGPISIYYGNGDATFQDPVLLPVSHRNIQLVIADVNRDNKPDLVLTDGGGITVIANLGGRNFDHEEHFVAGQGISGLSVVDVNGDGFPDIVAGNAGGTTVTVLLSEPNGQAGDGAPSNGVFTISPEPADYSQPITLTMTVSASGSTPTGSVSFSVDGAFVATVPLVNGKATYAFGTVLETGTHTFIATYNGDRIYRPESFSVLHVVRPPVYATQTVLVAAPKVVYTSQTVRFSATVTSALPVPAGVVTFMDGTSSLGAEPLDENAVALLDTALLIAGTHRITAVYQGYQEAFGHHTFFQPSTSSPVTVTVNSSPTTTSLSASSTSSTAGTVVTFTAHVTSGSGVPFGGVTFYDGTLALRTSSLKADGGCSYSTASLAVGTHNITAAFNANATFASSTSPVIVVTVTSAADGLAPTVVTLAATDSGDQSALVAKVSALSRLPVGEVIFLDNGNILGSAPTDGSGTASLPVPVLGGGVHNLSASFAGALQYAPSVSPELLEQFPAAGAGFSLNVAADSIDVTPAGSQPVLVTVVPTVGFQQQVQLSCAEGEPRGYTCSFSPVSLHSGSSYLRIRPTSNAARGHTRTGLMYGPPVGIFSFLLIGAVSRRRIRCLMLLTAGLGFMIMTGCGNPSASAEQPKMMVLSIRATAGTDAGTMIHSAQILVNIRTSE